MPTAIEKRPLPQLLKLVDLEVISRKCFKDPTFFQGLCKNVDKALAHQGWALRPPALSRLKTSLASLTAREKAILFIMFGHTSPKVSLWPLLGGKRGPYWA